MSEERHEGVVRQDAYLQAVICDMYALLALMEGMKAENNLAILERREPPHNGASFGIVSSEFEKLAKRFRTEI